MQNHELETFRFGEMINKSGKIISNINTTRRISYRMANGFFIRTEEGERVRFSFYSDTAPATCAAFEQVLPFARVFYHARVSGFEIWIDDAPGLDIPQENASIFPAIGEIVIGPTLPQRNRIKGCMGIFYGDGKLLDAGNIFGIVWEEDLAILQQLGDNIWRRGSQTLHFEELRS